MSFWGLILKVGYWVTTKVSYRSVKIYDQYNIILFIINILKYNCYKCLQVSFNPPEFWNVTVTWQKCDTLTWSGELENISLNVHVFVQVYLRVRAYFWTLRVWQSFFELISDNLIRFRTGYRTIYRTWRGDKIVPRCEEQLRDEQNDLSLTCHPIK